MSGEVPERGVGRERPVALVTGGAKRVGRAICLELAARGVDVVLTCRSSRAEAEGTADEVRSRGVEARVRTLDLGDVRAVQQAAEELARSLPRLDVLVHNASTYTPSPLDSLDAEQAGVQMTVNAISPLVLSAALAPLLKRSDLPGGGGVVAMLDVHTEGLPRRNHAAYTMSKAALGGLVRSLAVDLAPEVRVNGVAPGVVAWPDSGPEADEEAQQRYLRRVPLARSGTPEEAARAVAFLALEAHYTTGQVLAVDGGRSLK